MSQHRMSRKTKRNSIVAGAIAAVIIPMGVAGTAMAGDSSDGQKPPTQQQAAGQKSTSSSSVKEDGPTVAEVTEFYESYISARKAGDTEQVKSLREETLTPLLQDELAKWEEENNVDGVTRAQDVPVGVEVSFDGSGSQHSWTIVTLKWGGHAADTLLQVRTETDSKKISDIGTPV